jgi:tetratricopeptide (TPR) repeat protein
LNRIGDVQLKKGDLPAALTSYEAGLAIAERLAKSDPGNASWQRDLSVSLNRIGDVQMALGDSPAALPSYEAGLAIAERLAKSDPGNASWQRDLSVSLNRIGDVQLKKGDLPAALTSYEAGLAIAERLAKSDPGNAQWQDDLQVVIGGIGSLAYQLVLARDFARALDAADQVISLAPDQIWLYANRAHALMFLGRVGEARAVYLKYRAQKIDQNGKSWEAAVLEDFAELRKAGLANPLMDEIEKLFEAPG